MESIQIIEASYGASQNSTYAYIITSRSYLLLE
jgi:hypothetical protein